MRISNIITEDVFHNSEKHMDENFVVPYNKFLLNDFHASKGNLITETRTYKLWESAGRKLVEAELTANQINQLFQQIEQDATAAGGNRTIIGKGKDAATAINKAWEDLKTKVQNSGPVKNVDTMYDKAAEQLKQATGGDEGVMKYVQKYRDFAKKHPIAQSLIYSALIAAAGISGAGVGGAAALGLFKLVDKLLQGEKFSSAAYAGAKTGAMAYAAGQIGQALKGGQQPEAPTGTADAAASTVGNIGPRDVAKNALAIFKEKVANGEVTDYNSYQIAMQDALVQAGQTAGPTSQRMAQELLKAQLDGVAARAAGGTFSGSGPEKVASVIKALGGQVNQQAIDQANAAARSLAGGVQESTADMFDQLEEGIFGDLFGGTEKTKPGQLKTYAVYDGFTIYYDPAKEMFVTVGTGEYKDKFRAKGFPAHSASGGINMAEFYGQQMTGGKRSNPISMDRSAIAAGPHESVQESYIDQAETTRTWMLRESLGRSRSSVVLTESGVNVILEGVMDWLKTKGHNLTTKITADKLNSAWKKAGSPTDSAEIAKILTGAGVSQDVVDSVYQQLKIPTGAETVDPMDAGDGRIEPTMDKKPQPGDADYYGKGDPEETKLAVTKMTDQQLLSFTTKPGTDPNNPHVQIAKAELEKRKAGRTTATTEPAPAPAPVPSPAADKFIQQLIDGFNALTPAEKAEIQKELQSAMASSENQNIVKGVNETLRKQFDKLTLENLEWWANSKAGQASNKRLYEAALLEISYRKAKLKKRYQ